MLVTHFCFKCKAKTINTHEGDPYSCPSCGGETYKVFDEDMDCDFGNEIYEDDLND